MRSSPFPPSVERAGEEAVRQLARAHRCPPGCPGCAREQASSPALDLTGRHERFVRSQDALRLARAVRDGYAFPVVSFDEVVQFCVREAVMLRLATSDAMGAAADVAAQAADPALHAAQEAAKHFAATGEVR